MKPAVATTVVLLACLLASCQNSPPPPGSAPNPAGSAVADSTRENVSPIIRIQDLQEVDLEPGNKLVVWSLHAAGVRELAARLLVIKDGKAHVAQEAVYEWTWPSGREATWQLYYLLQNGEPFRAKNYRLPAFVLRFDDIAPWRINHTTSLHFVEGEFVSEFSQARKDNTIEPGLSEVVYYLFNDPNVGSSATFGRTVDALVEGSKGGRTAVALVLEWKPVVASQ